MKKFRITLVPPPAPQTPLESALDILEDDSSKMKHLSPAQAAALLEERAELFNEIRRLSGGVGGG